MPSTSTDIVNQALALIGDDLPLVTGTAPTFDDSKAGKAAQLLYGPSVRAVGRQFGWDFARKTVALTLTGNAAPMPWALEYAYPTNGLEVWDIFPPSEDPNDPLPYNFNVGNAVVGATTVRVVWTNLASALAVYNNNPTETAFDDSFVAALVRYLASEFAIALTGKVDLMQSHLEGFGALGQIAESRGD